MTVGKVLAFPGVTPPPEPEPTPPPSFDDWQIEVVGEFEAEAQDLGSAEEEHFYALVERLMERLQAMRDGPR